MLSASDGTYIALTDADRNNNSVPEVVLGVVRPSGVTEVTLATDIAGATSNQLVQGANGRVLATWTAGTGGDLFGQLIDTNGATIGATKNLGPLISGQMVASGNGFLKVGFAPANAGLVVETFDGSLNPTGSVTSSDLPSQSTASLGTVVRSINDVKLLPDGGFALVYSEVVSTGESIFDEISRNVFVRPYGPDGKPAGNAIEIGGDNKEFAPSIAVLENGEIAAAWRENLSNGELVGTKAMLFDVVYTEAGDVRTLDATTNQSVDLGVGTDHVAYATNRAGFQIFEPDSQGNAAEIVRLYDAFLGRAPDAGGFNFWLSQLDGGQSLGQIAQSFAASGEFQTYWGNVSNRAFVEEIYQRVLERTGDKGGVDYWTSRVGVDGRASVLLEIASSAEAKALPGAEAYVRAPNGSFDRLENVERVVFADGIVALDLGRGEHTGEALRMYDTAFDRGADRGGLTYWTRQLDAGLSLKDMAQAFINSAEGTDLRTASNTDFVKALYQRGLEREADSGGLNYWVGRVAADGKAAVLAEISESAEHFQLLQDQITTPVILDKYTIPGV